MKTMHATVQFRQFLQTIDSTSATDHGESIGREINSSSRSLGPCRCCTLRPGCVKNERFWPFIAICYVETVLEAREIQDTKVNPKKIASPCKEGNGKPSFHGLAIHAKTAPWGGGSLSSEDRQIAASHHSVTSLIRKTSPQLFEQFIFQSALTVQARSAARALPPVAEAPRHAKSIL